MDVINRTPVDVWVAKRLGIEAHELSNDKLIAWQLEAFRRTMKYAKEHGKFYRAHLHNFDPDSIRTMQDVEKLPFTSENDLSENEPAFQCVGLRDVSRVVTVPTTGTTNKIKRLGFTPFDQMSAMTFIGVGFETMCRPGDTMLIMMSGGTEGSIGDMVTKALVHMGISVSVHGTVDIIADAYEKIIRVRPNVIVGVPNQLAALSIYGKKFGNPEKEYIHSILASADFLPEAVRETICRHWECKVFNHYGMTEMCIAGGVECQGFSGYHTRDCDLLFEVVSPDASGLGEVVITTLDREGMPLIRYRTGDLARFVETPCPCGSRLRRLECIYSRKRNMLDIGGGAQISLTDIANIVFSEPHVIDYECALLNHNSVELIVKTLAGESADIKFIRDALVKNPRVSGAVSNGSVSFHISGLEMDRFSKGENHKKSITTKI